MVHDATDLTCVTEMPALGAAGTITIQHAPYRTAGKVGVRIRSVSAAFHYVQVIGGP